MISSCGSDENGKYHGGKAGDQTGNEWRIRTWYNHSSKWNFVARHPDEKVRNKIAENARAAANNNNVGYDQYQRTTYWDALVISDYNPAKISIKCEADCSSGIAANVKAAGYSLNIEALKSLSKDTWTGNAKANLKKAGFEILTDAKYLTSDDYLLPGDIIVNEKHHMVTNLDIGKKVKTSEKVVAKPVEKPVVKEEPKTTKYVVKVNTGLNVRTGPSTNYKIVTSYKNNKEINVVSINDGWAKLDNGYYVSANWIKKV